MLCQLLSGPLLPQALVARGIYSLLACFFKLRTACNRPTNSAAIRAVSGLTIRILQATNRTVGKMWPRQKASCTEEYRSLGHASDRKAVLQGQHHYPRNREPLRLWNGPPWTVSRSAIQLSPSFSVPWFVVQHPGSLAERGRSVPPCPTAAHRNSGRAQ